MSFAELDAPVRRPWWVRLLALAGLATGVVAAVAGVGVFARAGSFLLAGGADDRSLVERLWPEALLRGIGGLALAAVGLVVLTIARSVRQKTMSDVVLAGSKPLVLYLRSFGDDEQLAATGNSIIGTPLEVRLTRELRGLGALIALHDPTDPSMPFGAARAVADDDEWRDFITEALIESAWVVLLAGTTSSVVWEIEQIGSLKPPTEIVVLAARDVDQWNAFGRLWLDLTPATTWPELPRRRSDRWAPAQAIDVVITFDAAWTAYPVRLQLVNGAVSNYGVIRRALRRSLKRSLAAPATG